MQSETGPPPGGGLPTPGVSVQPSESDMSKDLIADGLLCKIVIVQSRTGNDQELVESMHIPCSSYPCQYGVDCHSLSNYQCHPLSRQYHSTVTPVTV